MGSESNQKGDDVWRQEFEKRYAQAWDDDGEKCVTRLAAHSFVLVLAEFKASETSTVRAVYECAFLGQAYGDSFVWDAPQVHQKEISCSPYESVKLDCRNTPYTKMYFGNFFINCKHQSPEARQ